MFNFSLPIYAMNGKVDAGKIISEHSFVSDFVSFHKCTSITDRFAVKLLINGGKMFLK